MLEGAGVDLIELSGGTYEALPWLGEEKVGIFDTKGYIFLHECSS